eukprot:scaffold718_cov342-Pavlova_lutheri.AAC.38
MASAARLSNAPCARSVRRRVVRVTASAASEPPKQPLKSVGFLGLGIMGAPMASRLINAGYEVTVWNRSPEKCGPLAVVGAMVASTPREAASKSDVTFAMMADPVAAEAVACGEEGVVHGMGPGKGYVDVSTVDVQTSTRIGDAIRATGAEFLEAPVSGSKGPAETGQLIFLTAGDEALYHRCAAAFDEMGKAKLFLGEVGQGAKMKLVVNMIMGSMMAAFAEGLSLGDAAGLDPKAILDVVSLGAISSPMFTLKGPLMLEEKFDPAFPLKHQQKDMRLAIALADELSQPMPVAASANELYKQARALGMADKDFCAVLAALQSDQA